MIYSPVQIEQEIGFIVDKKDIRAAFEASWTTSYVSALLKYGERSKKKTMKDICTKLVESGVCINTCGGVLSRLTWIADCMLTEK